MTEQAISARIFDLPPMGKTRTLKVVQYESGRVDVFASGKTQRVWSAQRVETVDAWVPVATVDPVASLRGAL